MTSYTCEATTLCLNFQSAICLHCNRRLCLAHITEHNQTVLNSSVQNLSDEVEVISKEINNQYEKSREMYHNILTSSNEWRLKQIERISQIYENHLQSVESQQEALNITHQQLTEVLDRDARQPLKYIQTQQNANPAILNRIQQTIEKVQKHSEQLKWNSSISLPADLQYPLPDPRSSTSNNNPSIPKTTHLVKLRSLNGANLRKYRSFKRLVEMFSDITSIEQGKNNIAAYIEKHRASLPLAVLVCSYLTAWYRKSDMNEKNIIINEHLSTIMKHIPYHIDDYTILLGIHAFFYNERIQGNKRELMTYLLQFFVEQKCISRKQVFNWYNNKDENGYKGFDGAKQMTAPFIRSLWTDNNGTNVQAMSTNSIDADLRV